MTTVSLILVLYKLIGSTDPVLYDLNKFSHLYKAIFTPDHFVCIKNLASHASEATTTAIGAETVRTPQ